MERSNRKSKEKTSKSPAKLKRHLYADIKTQAKARAQLVFIGEKKIDQVQSQLYEFNSDHYQTLDPVTDFGFIRSPLAQKNYWLNFHGIHDVQLVQDVGKQVGLDRLTIKQIIDSTQRSKLLEYPGYLFLTLKSILKQDAGDLKVEQISFVLGQHYIISFQEEPGDHFGGIRNKLVEGLGFVREKGCDYLLFQLIDAVLDNYFETIDSINQEIAELESEVHDRPDHTDMLSIETLKRSSQVIRKALGPFKEVLLSLGNSHSNLLNPTDLRFFKDLNNTVSAAIEEIESTMKSLDSLTDIYFAYQDQKMNRIMSHLTVVATIFIPLTFLAGVYGMNFDYMPELHYRYGYFIIWGVMVAISLLMVWFFRRKNLL